MTNYEYTLVGLLMSFALTSRQSDMHDAATIYIYIRVCKLQSILETNLVAKLPFVEFTFHAHD